MLSRSLPWYVLLVLCGVLTSGTPLGPLRALAAGPPQDAPASAVAVVNGKEITEQELLERVRGEVLKLEVQMYEVRRNGIDELIADHLVEQAAKARGLNPDQLMAQEVDAKVGEVTPKEVEEFYAANKARIRKTLEEVRPQVANYLLQSRLTEARRAYVKGLRDKAQVKVLLAPPVIAVSAEDAPFKGPPNAPITIVEFSDFQCSYCKRVLTVLNQVMEHYPDQVKLAFRDFPINNIHPHAQQAAEAAHCAGEQGKFWAYHDLLFEKQEAIPQTDHLDHAKVLGLEVTSFQTCLDSRKYKEKVERNYADGVKAGVSGTPAFFINGRPLSGAQPLEAFKAVIDEELDRLGLRAQR
jgi:protein-disulfide isomerase